MPFLYLTTCALAAMATALPAFAHAASLTTLYHFHGGARGGAPTGNLVRGPDGALYGVTETGGANGFGTVFRLDPPRQGATAWTVTTLYSFAGGADAATPNNLTVDAFGNLFGTSSAGGGSAACPGTIPGCGTVFEVSPAGGHWNEQVLHAFQGTDGQAPEGVSFDRFGRLFGFGFIGGPGICHFQTITFGCGTAFELTPVEGAPWQFNVIYNFKNDTDGDAAFGPPLIDAQGRLYGETEGGGPGAPDICQPATGCGEVFRLTQGRDGTWRKETIWAFKGLDGTTGANALTADWAGNIYGMTNEGGPPNPLCPHDLAAGLAGGCGVAFELSPPAHGTDTWTYTTIWDFTLGPDSGYPFNASITLANGRAFATSSGPYPLANSYGAIVEFVPPNSTGPWKEKTLFTFKNNPATEAQPESSLFLMQGQLYGVATGYSTQGSFGTVFRVKP